jgi:hypothetical protein
MPTTDDAVRNLSSDALLPLPIVPRGVQHRGDHNDSFVLNDFVNHSVGKALRIATANVFARMAAAVKQWVYRELIKHFQEFFDKSVTKTLVAAFIPRGDLDNVILCVRS